ncbi:MAG: symmetrical bis(5'-nucleosyl)-tetraphosphatase [Steroidobacteraceae bacterium]
MACWAVGDVQGCYDELRALLAELRFSADRDRLWFVGDLVNRGPRSLETLRFVRALGDNASVVLGNHDLHLLAVACGSDRKPRAGDTLDDVLAARDRRALLEWLQSRPLAHWDPRRGDLMVHAGLVPQWSVAQALTLAREVEAALRDDPQRLFGGMYGNKPDRWSDSLGTAERLRFTINVLTRLRFCTADGRIDLKLKDSPRDVQRPFMPWFEVPDRASRDARIIVGHWSTLGFLAARGVIALDTGCVWGGQLTAVDLDSDPPRTIRVPCAGYQRPDADA